MTSSRGTYLETLLEHQGFVRRLARSLVPADRVDDVVQETWVRACERPPRGSVRSWLARIARNFAYDLRAREGERPRRERSAARPEAQGEDDVQAALELQRRVGGALERLREPYRTTLFLRYWHELGPRAIAERQGLSIDTVKSRLRRGLELLRGELDRDFGDRDAWCGLLLPLANPRVLEAAGPLTSPIGAAVMNVQLKLALATVVAAGGLTVLWPFVRGAEEAAEVTVDPVAAEVARAPVARPAEAVEAASGASSDERTAVAAVPVESAPVEPVAPRPAVVVRGRVVDCEGLARGGVRIGLPASEGVRADADGRFELPVESEGGRLVALEPELATVLPGACRVGPVEPLVVVAPRLAVAGVVVDEGGRPLRDARVELILPAGFGARFETQLDATVQDLPSVRTDADGRFALDPFPHVAGARLETTLEGRIQDVRPAPDVSNPDLRIVLARARVATGTLRGVVLDASGRPVPEAHVAVGPVSAVSDAGGEFQLEPAAWSASAPIVAVKEGHLPGRLERAFDATGRPLPWPDWVELHLGESPRTLAGRVVDGDGEPVEGARVWLGDATLFGFVRDAPTRIEHVLSGAAAVDSFEFGRPNALWDWAETDARGRFRLRGLLERDYRVVAMGPDSLLAVEGGPFAAGRDDVVLRLADAPRYERLSGRVVAPGGEPVAGVEVALNRTVARIEIEIVEGGRQKRDRSVPGDRLVTGPDGRFEFEDVPAFGRCFCSFDGPGVIATWLELEGLDRTEDLEVTIQRRCNFRIELADPRRADRVEVLDPEGLPMSLFILRHESSYEDLSVGLVDGKSDVLAVGERAATLVLTKEGEVVERVPLNLSTDDLTLVRL